MPSANQLRVVLFCVATACAYGAIHDQFTVRMCPEYFTVFHPRFFPSESPTILALCWGCAATLPVGLVFGGVLARLAESPGAPPVAASSFVRPLAILFASMTVAAVASGFAGFELARRALVVPPAVIGDALPVARHRWLMAVWFTHAASYAIGVGGALVITLRLWLARGRPRAFTLLPDSPAALLRLLVVLAVGAWLVWLRIHAD